MSINQFQLYMPSHVAQLAARLAEEPEVLGSIQILKNNNNVKQTIANGNLVFEGFITEQICHGSILLLQFRTSAPKSSSSLVCNAVP